MQDRSGKNRKILMCGDFTWDHLSASYKRTFEVMGHRVHSVHTTERGEKLSSWLSPDRIGRYVAPWLEVNSNFSQHLLSLRRHGSKDWNDEVVSAAADCDPDFVFIINGDFVMPETVEELRSRGYPVYIFHADSPFPPSPNARPEHLPCAKACTSYFIWSRKLVRRLKDHGVDAHYLPFGWDPFVFPYQEGEKEARYDVVFIGGWTKRRENWLTPVAEEFDLTIWGPDYWGSRTSWGSPVRSCWKGRAIRHRQAAEVLSRSKIALNILRPQNLPDGTNMRTFEVAGSGGFLLSTRSEGAKTFFPEKEAGAYFDTANELVEKIHYYLDQDNRRRSISREAHRRTRESHRYRRRARKILQVHSDQVRDGIHEKENTFMEL